MNRFKLARTVLVMTGILGLVAAGLVMAETGPAFAASMRYGVTVTSRAVEGYGQIPTEVNGGSPSGVVFLEDPNVPFCEGYAGVYDLGLIIDDYVSAGFPAYQNPMRVHVANPGGSRKEKEEFKSFPNGPSAVGNCESPSKGTMTATWGGYAGDQAFQFATVKSASERVAGENTILTEASAFVQGIKLGDSTIRNFESMVNVTYKPDVPPLITYRISLQGFTNGKETLFSNGEKGVVLSGQNVAGPDFAKQFNSQAKAHEGDLKVLATYGFHFVEPRYFQDEIQSRDVIMAPVLDGSLGFTARKGGIGQAQGMRIGMSRISGRVTCCSPD